MEREILRVEFVTPCFLGGASQDGASQGAEWRAASIRGQLRWWFRAVAGAEHSLVKVRELEEVIFGSTERQARLRIRAFGGPEPQESDTPFRGGLYARQIAERWKDTSAATIERLRVMRDGREIRSNPLHYLGFGPFEKVQLKRSYLPAGQPAEFSLDWRAGVIPSELKSLFEDALWAWLSLGGIGAKGRKGYGSLRLLSRTSAKSGEPIGTRQAFEERARQLLERARSHTKEAEWTHFSAGSRIFAATSQGFTSWQQAMEHLGSWLIAYRRRYGYPGDSRVVDGLDLENRDYDWAAPGGGNPGHEIPDRAGFGLPLPFKRRVGTRWEGENVTWALPGDEKDGDTRRASPLLLHIARFGSSYVPILTHLPAKLIPGKLKFEGSAKMFKPTDRQLGIIDEFLDDLAAKSLIEEVKP